MIPKNKRHLIVNKEYSRLPYWTDEGYEDIQKQTSQKYIQDTYGAFAESENQLPYLSDADYQGLEYQYQNPEYFDPTDLPDVDFTDTVPKGTCYELWASIFGHGTGAFIPTASEWNKLNEYAKKCPLIYTPHICCLNMKITGPDSVAPGETVEYSVSGGDAGCAYDMEASGGEFVGNKYFAPMTPGTYELSVTPWMSDDSGKKCAKKTVTVISGWTEPWDDSLTPTLCKNHNWTFDYLFGTELCPSLPASQVHARGTSELSMASGELAMTATATGPGSSSHMYSRVDLDCSWPDAPTLSAFTMKINSSCVYGAINTYGYNIYIKDSVGNAQYLAFGGYYNKSVVNGVSNDVGLPDGTEKIIDLSIYRPAPGVGFASGKLQEFRIETWCGNANTNQWTIDYIEIS